MEADTAADDPLGPKLYLLHHLRVIKVLAPAELVHNFRIVNVIWWTDKGLHARLKG